jgi:hypothetical protein
MRYTTEDGGRLNNFAVEPKVYKAEPPTEAQRRNYLFMGIGAIALLSSLIFVAISASNVG